MVTISFKKHHLIIVAEALGYYGSSVKHRAMAVTLIEILNKLKKAEKSRATKDIYNMVIIRIQKFNDLPISTYKKSKMAG